MYNISAPGEYSYELSLIDDSCDSETIILDSISPIPSGAYSFGNDIFTLNPNNDDVENKFTVFFSISYMDGWKDWRLTFDTRTNPTPAFTDCPDTIIAYPCNTIWYDLKAHIFPVIDTIYKDRIEFESVSGPGFVSDYGRWSYQPDVDDIGNIYEVEIAAKYGIFKTEGEENCRFYVKVEESQTGIFFSNYNCGDTIAFNPPRLIKLPFNSINKYNCEQLDVSIVDYYPQTEDAFRITSDRDKFKLLFSPTSDNYRIIYKVKLGAFDGVDSVFCELYFKHFLENLDPVSISIENIYDATQGQEANVYVNIDSTTNELQGFDLLLEYYKNALTFQYAELGEAFGENGCDWEYFAYRYYPQYPLDDFTRIKIMGIAETNNGNDHPNCYLPDSFPSALFSLRFLVTNDRNYSGQYAPVRFYWEECDDNTIVMKDINTRTFVSSSVFDKDSLGNIYDITDKSSPLPTNNGLNIFCYNKYILHFVRLVNFTNGGILISKDSTFNPLLRGDINLNTIPYEVADAVLYSRYFVYGENVFVVNKERQIENSDANADGIPLTIEDLVQIIRVIIGDAEPYPKISTSTPEVVFYSAENSNTLYVAQTTDSIGAVYIKMKNNQAPEISYNNMEMIYHYDSTITRTLIYSLEGKGFAEGNLLNNITDSIIEIQAATTKGEKMNVRLAVVLDVEDEASGQLPQKYALYQNYPNPFNGSTVISFDLPKASAVRLEIINILGETVFESEKFYPAGNHSFDWDGTNQSGQSVASGIYYYRISTEEMTDSKKMLLLK